MMGIMMAIERRNHWSDRNVSVFFFHLCDLVCGLDAAVCGLKLCMLSWEGLGTSSLARGRFMSLLGGFWLELGWRYNMLYHSLDSSPSMPGGLIHIPLTNTGRTCRHTALRCDSACNESTSAREAMYEMGDEYESWCHTASLPMSDWPHKSNALYLIRWSRSHVDSCLNPVFALVSRYAPPDDRKIMDWKSVAFVSPVSRSFTRLHDGTVGFRRVVYTATLPFHCATFSILGVKAI